MVRRCGRGVSVAADGARGRRRRSRVPKNEATAGLRGGRRGRMQAIDVRVTGGTLFQSKDRSTKNASCP
jgi:hypothetical protein